MLFNPSLDVKAKLGRLSNILLGKATELIHLQRCPCFLLMGFDREVAVSCRRWSDHDEEREKSSVVVFRVRCCCHLFLAYSETAKTELFACLSLSPADTLSSMWIPADGCHDKHWGDFSWALFPAASTRGLRLNLKANQRLENHFLAVSRNLPRHHLWGIIGVQPTRFWQTALYQTLFGFDLSICALDFASKPDRDQLDDNVKCCAEHLKIRAKLV